MEKEQVPKDTGPTTESVLDEINEEKLSFDEYYEGVKKCIQPWGEQAERIMDFHLELLEGTVESPTPINLLKALSDYRGYRRGLLSREKNSLVIRYFEDEFTEIHDFLAGAIARVLAKLSGIRFYRIGVMENVAYDKFDEEREEEKEKYLEYKKVSKWIFPH